jgi:molybdate transport system substrate-binding protein
MNIQATKAAAIGLALVLAPAAAGAADIKILSTNALKTVVEELGPQFEKTTEHKLVVKFDAGANLMTQIGNGEPFDLVILANTAVDDLIKQGKLVSTTRADLARAGIGVAVRKGAPKPDISTTEAFKRTLLDAQSIAYVEQGGTGIYFKELLPRLGIADQLKAKTKLLPASNPAARAIANGEAEIGMTQISEILPYAGAELVGPLPPEIQLYSILTVAVGANAKEPEAAKALVKFLTSPAAAPVIKAKGLDQPG